MIVGSKASAIGFMALPNDGGCGTWTLTSRLGWLLRQAEGQFGCRDKSYTLLGIEFGAAGPMVWYPEAGRDVIIQLSNSAAQNIEQAFLQLAHEVVHLLAPSGARNALVVEEGLATYFADEMSRRVGSSWHSGGHDYLKAKALVEKLLSNDSHAVKKIRETEPDFCKWTPDLIQAVVPDALSGSELTEICSPFYRPA